MRPRIEQLFTWLALVAGCATQKPTDSPTATELPPAEYSFEGCTATATFYETDIRCGDLGLSVISSPRPPGASLDDLENPWLDTLARAGIEPGEPGSVRIHDIDFSSRQAEGGGWHFYWLTGESPTFLAIASCTAPAHRSDVCERATRSLLTHGVPPSIVTAGHADEPRFEHACKVVKQGEGGAKLQCRSAYVYEFRDLGGELEGHSDEFVMTTLDEPEVQGFFYALGRPWTLWRSPGKDNTDIYATAAREPDGPVVGYVCRTRRTTEQWVCVSLLMRLVTYGPSFAEKPRLSFDLEPPAPWIRATDAEVADAINSETGAFFENMEPKGVWRDETSGATAYVAYNDHFEDGPVEAGFASLMRPIRGGAEGMRLTISSTALAQWPFAPSGEGLWVDEQRLRSFMRRDTASVRTEATVVFTRTGFITMLVFGPIDTWSEESVRRFYEALQIPREEALPKPSL